MQVIWLYLVLEGATVIYVDRKVTPVLACIYREYHEKTEDRYIFYMHVTGKCPPYVRHRIEEMPA
jgi:hypothetical protein|tara:strand:+ start:483 stop:677 length:195 start_codon:yes stop_codon:yes gene_type:complete